MHSYEICLITCSINEIYRKPFAWILLGRVHLSFHPASMPRACEITVKEYYLLFHLTIRLRARDFYAVIVDEGEARINYQRIEIESE